VVKYYKNGRISLCKWHLKVCNNKNNKMIGWILNNKYQGKHMSVEILSSKQSVVTLRPYKMEADAVFIVSIERLLEDILRSVKDCPDGYLEKLKIYDPNTRRHS
jgi:hypothetical protein